MAKSKPTQTPSTKKPSRKRLAPLRKNVVVFYLLQGKRLTPAKDIHEFAEWFEKSNRILAKTKVKGFEVSTVFLGIDYNPDNEGEPILFETMIFKGKKSLYQERYHTWDEAMAGHNRIAGRLQTDGQI